MYAINCTTEICFQASNNHGGVGNREREEIYTDTTENLQKTSKYG